MYPLLIDMQSAPDGRASPFVIVLCYVCLLTGAPLHHLYRRRYRRLLHLADITSQQDEKDSSTSEQKLLPVVDRASPGILTSRSLSPSRRTITYVLNQKIEK